MTRIHTVAIGIIAFAWTGRPASSEDTRPPDRSGFVPASNKDLLESQFVGHVRRVIAAVVTTAKDSKRDGDARTEELVRAAASVPAIPDRQRARALVIGLAVAMDPGMEMRASILTRRFWTVYETDSEREARVKVLGRPTIHGRADLAKHFFISAGLTAVMTPDASEAAGILKEVSDANGGTGFSWIDMAADLAGIEFAHRLILSPNVPDAYGRHFTVASFVPKSILELPEGIMIEELRTEFSLDSRVRFLAEVDRVRQRILDLPIYADRPASGKQSVSR